LLSSSVPSISSAMSRIAISLFYLETRAGVTPDPRGATRKPIAREAFEGLRSGGRNPSDVSEASIFVARENGSARHARCNAVRGL